QRALADLIASVPGVPVYRWSIPRASWARRRWLGLDPPGAIERHDLLAKLQAEGAEAAAILLALPLADRIEAFADLELGPFYNLDAPGIDEVGLDGDLGAAGKDWAPGFADRLLALFAAETPSLERGDRSEPEWNLRKLLSRALLGGKVPL